VEGVANLVSSTALSMPSRPEDRASEINGNDPRALRQEGPPTGPPGGDVGEHGHVVGGVPRPIVLPVIARRIELRHHLEPLALERRDPSMHILEALHQGLDGPFALQWVIARGPVCAIGLVCGTARGLGDITAAGLGRSFVVRFVHPATCHRSRGEDLNYRTSVRLPTPFRAERREKPESWDRAWVGRPRTARSAAALRRPPEFDVSRSQPVERPPRCG
jgi:hypothetical protein